MKRKPDPIYTGTIFPAGSKVRVLRPHLYSGCKAVVESVTNGRHRLVIKSLDGVTYSGGFHTDADFSELKALP